MGEACEHYLYDKGYGPTNLTLKHYLAMLFGGALADGQAGSRTREPTLIPLADEMHMAPASEVEPTRIAIRPSVIAVRPVNPKVKPPSS
jgi:hypothetical protein